MSRRAYELLAALALTCTVSRSVAADEPNKAAGQHFQNGLRFARGADLDRAAKEFEEAYRLSPHPSVLYNLGQTYASLGRPVDAVRTLKSYLQAVPNVSSARREEVEALIAFHEKRIGKLELSIVPAGEVLVDGQPVSAGEAAQTIDVGVGMHSLLAQRTGYRPAVLRTEVRPGESSKVELKLEPLTQEARTSSLNVSCPLDEVNVRVDGQLVGRTPLLAPVQIQIGQTVTFDRPGYTTSEQVIGETGAAVACNLRPSPQLSAQTGARLDVVSSTPSAITLVDGTRYTGALLPPGKHTVIVESSGYHPIQQLVSLKPGRTTRLDLELAPTAKTRRDSRDEAAARQRLYSYVGGAAGLLLCGAAATIYVVNSDRYDDYQRDGEDFSRKLASGMATAQDAQEAGKLNDRAASIQRWDTLALASGIAGVALLGTSVTLFVTAGNPTTRDDQAQSVKITVRGLVW